MVCRKIFDPINKVFNPVETGRQFIMQLIKNKIFKVFIELHHIFRELKIKKQISYRLPFPLDLSRYLIKQKPINQYQK